jgi:hypothetical protein
LLYGRFYVLSPSFEDSKILIKMQVFNVKTRVMIQVKQEGDQKIRGGRGKVIIVERVLLLR